MLKFASKQPNGPGVPFGYQCTQFAAFTWNQFSPHKLDAWLPSTLKRQIDEIPQLRGPHKMIVRNSFAFLIALMLVNCSNKAIDKKLCFMAISDTNIPDLESSDLSLQGLKFSEKNLSFYKTFESLFDDQTTHKFVCNFRNGNSIYLLGGEVVASENPSKTILVPNVLQERIPASEPLTSSQSKVIWRRGI